MEAYGVSAEINGDLRLSAVDRLRYLWQNFRRNIASGGRGPSTRAFVVRRDEVAGRICGQSPSRLLTELFIDRELPGFLPIGEVRVLEIGCGSGSLLRRLAVLGYRGQYTGVDVQDRFQRDLGGAVPFTTSFVQSDIHSVTPDHPIDLLVSISAIEHIPCDRKLIARLSEAVRAGGVELHAVPAPAGLIAYLWHGYRQYTRARIADRFGSAGVNVVRLGGLGSFMVHVLSITIPELLLGWPLRRSAPGFYAALLQFGLMLDRVAPIAPTSVIVIRQHAVSR